MILVTGAAGFIGGRLTAHLSKRHFNEIKVLPVDPKFGDANVMYDKVLPNYGDAIAAVFHLGAISDTTCADGDALNRTNFVLPKKLGRFCMERRIPFIYASSASIYGNGDAPLNDYAVSKLMFDLWACDWLRGIDWYGCRFFNVYGPGEAHKGEQASLVHQIIETQRDAERPKLFLAEEMKRDFIHVDDVVDVMLWMWRTRPASGIYDVGTGEAYSISRLHYLVEQEMGISHDYEDIGVPPHLEGKLQMSTCADLRKLRAAGYDKEFTPLREGIRRMLK